MLKKVAVVTGANQGIGFAILKGLCKHPYPGDVILTSRNEQAGQIAVDELKKEGLTALFHRLDVTDRESIEKLRDYLVKNYGGLDVLVNNAGTSFKANAPEPFAVQAEITMNTNFFGTLQASKILLPILKPESRVVNISSIFSKDYMSHCSPELQAKFHSKTITEEELVSLMSSYLEAAKVGDHVAKGWPNMSYAVSKIGVTVMTQIHARQISAERPADNILVNCCCPGYVRTSLTGPNAPKSPEEGAETPLFLALLPASSQGPHGEFMSEKKLVEW
ncbi:carbonyl reductase [NADPH] 1-like [Protopterus annectens]|uniref:carbonyl reductase [NADPH] 1-like n=1 Tax=Protopterus annectens TaxID=7888 RepID=UPI001CFC2BF1|nr:carbonyl reductase [NADPH] 1-like [Protopterus annectens]